MALSRSRYRSSKRRQRDAALGGMTSQYPLPVYNFRVTVDGTSMAFSEVSGLKVEHDHVTYRDGLSFLEGEVILSFYYDSYFPVTMKRGTVLGNAFTIYDWLGAKSSRSLDVSLCDEEGAPVLTWRVAEARPVKLEAPSFDANSNDVAIDSFELMARGVSMIDHS